MPGRASYGSLVNSRLVPVSPDVRADAHRDQARQHEKQEIEEQARGRDFPVRPEILGDRVQTDQGQRGADRQKEPAEPASPHTPSLSQLSRSSSGAARDQTRMRARAPVRACSKGVPGF